MRVLAVACLILLVGVCATNGVLIEVLDAPHDDPAIRESLKKLADAKRLNKDYNAALERYFFGLGASQARTVFGARLPQAPALACSTGIHSHLDWRIRSSRSEHTR